MKDLSRFFKQVPDQFPPISASTLTAKSVRPLGGVALITSAFHMGRAMRLAQGERLDFEPFPTCYRSSVAGTVSPKLLIPSADAASDFGRALKEVLAKLVGR